MIIITDSFRKILDDWLSDLSLTRPDSGKSSTSAEPMTLSHWKQEVHAAVALAPGPARGLDIGSRVQLRHVGALGYLAVNSRTLGQFFDTYLAFEKWFYGSSLVATSMSETHFEMCWEAKTVGDLDRLIEQIHSVALLTVIGKACPTAGDPIEVSVINPERGERELYEKTFGCPVKFEQTALRLVFPLAALDAPIDAAKTSLNAAWETRQRTLREAFPGAIHFVQAVQEAMMLYLPSGAPTDLVAASLNLSRRTLQRRLSDAGCSYRQLLDGVRESHARNLLEDPQLSLKEIAFLLGYSEQSAFNHAYRRWNKKSPLQARP
jgi:AraC-like DNA-binding protein